MAFTTLTRPADGVARLHFDRTQKRNSLSIAARDEMSDALDELAVDPSVRVVIISTEGPAFSAGFDLKEFAEPDLQQELSASSDRWHTRLREFPLPLIASVQGPALAGGFDLAMMCDLRVVAESATFARPEIGWAPPIYSIVRDLVGGAAARELSMVPATLSAQRAQELGLVTRLVADDALASATLDLATDIAAAPRSVLEQTKRTAITVARFGDTNFPW